MTRGDAYYTRITPIRLMYMTYQTYLQKAAKDSLKNDRVMLRINIQKKIINKNPEKIANPSAM